MDVIQLTFFWVEIRTCKVIRKLRGGVFNFQRHLCFHSFAKRSTGNLSASSWMLPVYVSKMADHEEQTNVAGNEALPGIGELSSFSQVG